MNSITIKSPLYLLAMLTTMAITGCSNYSEVNEPPVNPEIDPVETEYTVAEINAVALTQGFNYDFFKEVCVSESNDKNVVVSPLSAQMLLSMLANTTDPASTDEITRALGCDDLQALNGFNSKCLATLPVIDASTKIALASSVWFHNAYSLNPAFVAMADASYHVDAFSRNFADAEAVVDEVNGWCDKKTSGLIPQIINKLDGVSMIINALYFKGEWANPFKASETVDKNFNGHTKTGTVKMMHKTGMQHYASAGNYEAVKLELGKGSLSVAFVLPREGKDMDSFMADFDYTKFMNTRYSDRVIDFSLAKCKLEPAEFDLQKALTSLGIKGIFQPGQISLFEETVEGQFNVYQKSGVEFSEKGAEGASVSWATEFISPGSGNVAEIPVVTFDRPYLFFITDSQTGVCLMAGRVMNL